MVYALKSSIRVWSNTAQDHLSIVENQGQTVGVAVDVKNGYVFWTDVSDGKEAIYRAKVNREGPVEKIVDSGKSNNIHCDYRHENIQRIEQ